MSSSRRLVVVRLSVSRSPYQDEKVTFRVSDGNLNLPKTYLVPTYLCDRSFSNDSNDSSDRSGRSDSSDGCNLKTFFLQK